MSATLPLLDPVPQLIETMCCTQGRITLWPGHRARLMASARALGYPLDADALQALLSAHLLSLNPVASRPTSGAEPAWRIRLLLAADGQLSLTSTPLPDTAPPVRIALASAVRMAQAPMSETRIDGPESTPHRLPADSPWLRHKTTHRPWFSAAEHWLREHPDHFDLIFGNAAGELCEGSRSNIYVRGPDGQWLTPPVSHGLLPGVQRQALLDRGVVREAALSLNDLRQAPAVRISNALRGWLDASLS